MNKKKKKNIKKNKKEKKTRTRTRKIKIMGNSFKNLNKQITNHQMDLSNWYMKIVEMFQFK